MYGPTNVTGGEYSQDALLPSSKDVFKIVPEAKVVDIVHFSQVPDLHPAISIIERVVGY